MKCFDCASQGAATATIGICDHCLAALRQHGVLKVKGDRKPDEPASGSAVAER
jgi:hypothetical protein